MAIDPSSWLLVPTGIVIAVVYTSTGISGASVWVRPAPTPETEGKGLAPSRMQIVAKGLAPSGMLTTAYGRPTRAE